MNANKAILLGVAAYAVLFILSWILFTNTKFTGSDAAGNGLEKGLAFIFGLGLSFLIAIIFIIACLFYFSDVTETWIKFIAFLPLVLPGFLFATEILEIGKPQPPSLDEQSHQLTLEIKSNTPLDTLTFLFRSSRGGGSRKLKLIQKDADQYLYEHRQEILYEYDRKFKFYSKEFKTQEYVLDIPYEPQEVPFTEWKSEKLPLDADTIQFEYRFKVNK